MPSDSATTVGALLTIGHSSHPLERFVSLLRDHKIDAVADIRSQPYSRFAPQFNREPLAVALGRHGIKYVFLGRELGGRPDGDEYYDDEGHVLYGRVAASPLFVAGVARLENGLSRYRPALMCSEEDPTDCHRRLLVTRVLNDRGVKVVHVRGDGRVQRERDLTDGSQGDIFNGFEETAWRSIRSVSHRRAPLSSSTS